MEKGPRLVGRISEKGRESVEQSLEMLRQKALEPIPSELEKSPEDILMIEKTNSWLQQEFEELGIENIPKPIAVEQGHFFRKDSAIGTHLSKMGLKGEVLSAADPLLIINKDLSQSKLDELVTVLHESIHLQSMKKMYVEEKEGETYADDYRVGYDMRAVWKGDTQQIQFRMVNETVVETLAVDILRRHTEEIERDFGIPNEELEEYVNSSSDHAEYTPLLGQIISRVAAEKKVSIRTIWDNYFKGEFTGEMMHMRDIDRIYGKGSIRLLAHMKRRDMEEGYNDMLEEYFSTNDENRRGELKTLLQQQLSVGERHSQ